MKLCVNGKEEQMEMKTVKDMLNHYQLDPKKVVVELNKTIVKREQFHSTPLKENDAIEIVTIVGGG